MDPSKYWWGLTWNALLDFDNFNQEQEQKLYVDFQKAQYSLLHVLSENFGMHDKHIIAEHDPVQLVEKLKVKHTVEPCGTVISRSACELLVCDDIPAAVKCASVSRWLPVGLWKKKTQKLAMHAGG